MYFFIDLMIIVMIISIIKYGYGESSAFLKKLEEK